MIKRILPLIALGCAPLALGACQTTSAPPPPAATALASEKASPPAFIEAACGGCHAVEPPFLSPNPHAPTFESIANREGLTEATIADWLTDAHNYPEVMDFDLEADHIEQVADYMISLQRDNYEPTP